MLSKNWRVALLAVIIGFSLWQTDFSYWIILVAAVLLLVFEVGNGNGMSSGKSVTQTARRKKKKRR